MKGGADDASVVPVTSRGVDERRRRRTGVFAVMVIALLVTHVVQWEPGEGLTLLRFIPWDLGYHLLWMVAASGAVLYMTEVLWRHPPEDDAS